MALSSISKLEAVISMLSSIGEAPINQLNEATVDSAIAVATLDEVSRNVQSIGWHFNTDSDFPLAKNADGTVTISSDIVRVDIDSALYPSVDVVQRNGLLYDRKNHTNVFTIELKAEIIRLLDWDDLPQPFRAYVTAKAARILQQRMVGSTEIGSQLAQDEINALVALREFDGDTGDYNIFDAYDVAKVLQRN